jgi:hypothetical protein
MLFTDRVLRGLKAGRIDLALRRWTALRTAPGSSVLTSIGRVEIVDVDPIRAVSPADARCAGYASVDEALADLRPSGTLYRIRLRLAGPDPRIALRPKTADLDGVLVRLGARGRAVLRLLSKRPGVRAGDLAPLVGRPVAAFKRDVRRLKSLGLTISLGTGYRLSPRGRAVLRKL